MNVFKVRTLALGKWKKKIYYFEIYCSLMIENLGYRLVCKLNIGKPDSSIFLNSEPLHNENEKRAIILQFIVI